MQIGRKQGDVVTSYDKPTMTKGKLVAIIVGMAIVFLVGFAFIQKQTLQLKTYDGQGYTILVPESYKLVEDNGQQKFIEETSDKSSQSQIAFGIDEFGSVLTQEEFNDFKAVYSQASVEDFVTRMGTDTTKVTNIAVTTKDFQSQILYTGTADLEQEDEVVGTATFRMEYGTDGGQYVVVIAYNDDQSLQKNAQDIIDSLEID